MRQFSEDTASSRDDQDTVCSRMVVTTLPAIVEGENHVAGECQLFRRRCFEEIGGYFPNAAGGVDWIAVMSARMKGWKAKSFPQKRFHHHRTLETAKRQNGSQLRMAKRTITEVVHLMSLRVAYRATKQPIDGAALSGYCWAAARRMKRPVSRRIDSSGSRRWNNRKSCGTFSLACLKLQKDQQLLCGNGPTGGAVRINESGDKKRSKSRTSGDTQLETTLLASLPTSLIGWRATVKHRGITETFFAGLVGGRAKGALLQPWAYRDGGR